MNLIISPVDQEKIAAVLKAADEHRLTTEEMMMLAFSKTAIGTAHPEFCCELESQFRICFSYEQQSFGYTRHISISVPGPFAPNMHAVNDICAAFKFKQDILRPASTLIVYMEGKAVSIVEREEERTIVNEQQQQQTATG